MMIYTEPTTFEMDANSEILVSSASPLILTNVPKGDKEPKHLSVAAGGNDIIRFSTWRKRKVQVRLVDENIPYQVIQRKRQMIRELSSKRKKVAARDQGRNELEEMMHQQFLKYAANMLGEQSVEFETLEESLNFDIDEDNPLTSYEMETMIDEQIMLDEQEKRAAGNQPANKKPAASEPNEPEPELEPATQNDGD